MNISSLQWDDELLSIWNIPRKMLPEIRSSSEVYDEVSVELRDYDGALVLEDASDTTDNTVDTVDIEDTNDNKAIDTQSGTHTEDELEVYPPMNNVRDAMAMDGSSMVTITPPVPDTGLSCLSGVR